MLVNYKFKDGSESLSSHTGLALVGALLERTDLKGRLLKNFYLCSHSTIAPIT